MMSSHGANPIFFNKKITIGCPERPESGRHTCITPKNEKTKWNFAEISAKFRKLQYAGFCPFLKNSYHKNHIFSTQGTISPYGMTKQ